MLVVKNLPADAGDIRDVGLIPGSGRSPGEAHGNPLQYSCLKNPMNRGVCKATVHRVTKSQTQLKQLHTHTHTHTQSKILYSFRKSIIYIFIGSYKINKSSNSQLKYQT